MMNKSEFLIEQINHVAIFSQSETLEDTQRACLEFLHKTGYDIQAPFTPAETPLTVSPHPKYIRELIEEGFIDSDLKVLTNLDDVAIALQRKLRNRITKYHLQTFKNPQTGKEYSPSARERAVTASEDEFYHRTKNPQ